MDARARIDALAALPAVDQLIALPAILRDFDARLRGAIVLDEVARVCVAPGEVVVVRIKGRRSCEELERLNAHLQPVFPGVKVLVLDGGVTLDVVSPDKAKELKP